MQKALNFNDVAIASVKGSNYRIYFWYMSQYDVISIIKKFWFKRQKWIILRIFWQYIKVDKKKWLLSKTTETKILNRAKWYYKNNKDWLREQTRNSLSDSILYSFFRFLSDIN